MQELEEMIKSKLPGYEIETDGYNYHFNTDVLHVHFCVQDNRIVGKMYQSELNQSEVEKEAKNVDIKTNRESWIEFTRKYDYRSFVIWGYANTIFPELVRLANLPREDYIKERIAEEDSLKEMVDETMRQRAQPKS